VSASSRSNISPKIGASRPALEQLWTPVHGLLDRCQRPPAKISPAAVDRNAC
jgi:hypothetical protein